MQSALAYEVRDIRIEGLQNVEPGIVFRNFPVKEGDDVSDRRLSNALRTLFASGYFNDLELSKDGDVLVIKVVERPTIAVIRLEGNKDVEDEQLLDGIGRQGVKEGEVFRQSAVEQIRNDLVSVYASRGSYGAAVDTQVEDLPGNRVALNITIDEGKESSIQHINIIGNQAFDNDTLTGLFESSLPGLFSWFTSDDQYAQQKLAGDLERLRSYYLNRGYINFQIDSTQVSISPDKANVFITINITEGAQYLVRDFAISGDLVV
ncbi:MAG: outer membrane protein assembly factor BamA, partial [Pontibacterium sp.]